MLNIIELLAATAELFKKSLRFIFYLLKLIAGLKHHFAYAWLS